MDRSQYTVTVEIVGAEITRRSGQVMVLDAAATEMLEIRVPDWQHALTPFNLLENRFGPGLAQLADTLDAEVFNLAQIAPSTLVMGAVRFALGSDVFVVVDGNATVDATAGLIRFSADVRRRNPAIDGGIADAASNAPLHAAARRL